MIFGSLLSILFCLGPGSGLFAQQGRADSVQAASLEAQAGIWVGQSNITKAWECVEKAAALYRSKGDKAAEAGIWIDATRQWPTAWKPARDAKIEAYSRARRIYLDLHDTPDAILTLKTIADFHLTGDQLVLAKQELLEVLDAYGAMRFPKIYYTYDLLHAVCKAQGDITGEIFYAIRMIETADSARADVTDLTFFYLRLAEAYRDGGFNDRSLAFTRKAFNLGSDRANTLPPIIAASAYGLDLISNDSAARALAILTPLLHSRAASNIMTQVLADYILCLANTAQQKPALAEQAGLRCVQLADSLYSHHSSDVPQHALILFHAGLSEAYIAQGEYAKAEASLDRLRLEWIIPTGLIDLQRLALDRSRIDSGLHKFDSSLVYFKLYKHYSDSLFGIEKAIHFAEINTKYETEKKDKDIRLLQQENKLQQDQAQRSRSLRNTMIAGLLLFLVFFILLYSRYRTKQRLAAQLALQKEEILDKNTTLEKLLHENQWLLREVHHRVKNNLQMVTSLLQSQSAFLTDPKALDAVADSQSRVHAMALIHQKLYNGLKVSTIDMQDYVNDLIDYLKDTVQPDQRIIFDIRVDKISLDVNQAISIGLILNEVITNSIKYAFVGTTTPSIYVWLKQTPDSRIELRAADNGRGLPPGLDIHDSHSFGFRLILGLAQDLEAKISLVDNGGVEYLFSFEGNASMN